MKQRMLILVAVSSMLIASLMYATGCAASSQNTAESVARADASATSFEWSEDADCATCHTVESHSFEDSASIASLHGTLTCLQCHDDAATLSTIHEGVTTEDWAPKRLKLTAVSEDTCISCHISDDLVAATSASTVLTDLNGTTVNQHQLPVTESGVHQEIICADCHEMHADAAAIDKEAQDYCVSCHHADVYECYTCHEHG
jgi:hypothetical protein